MRKIMLLIFILTACAPAPAYRMALPLIEKPKSTAQRFGAYWRGPIQNKYIVPGQWVKMDVVWQEVEPVRGQPYNWSKVLDRNIQALAGSPILLNFHNSPAWAVKDGILCRLPDDGFRQDYVNLILAAVDRYQPNAIEVWNEPATDASFSRAVGYCCGCVIDPREYADLQNMVYAQVKERFPNVIVLGGALAEWETAWARKWFALQPAMDAVSFHFYSYYPKIETSELDQAVNALRAQTNKPLWLSETSELCPVIPCDAGFRPAQAGWLSAIQNADVEKIFWYTQTKEGWMDCYMLDEQKGIVYPVYLTFRNLVSAPPAK